jgi:hypothetical protein
MLYYMCTYWYRLVLYCAMIESDRAIRLDATSVLFTACWCNASINWPHTSHIHNGVPVINCIAYSLWYSIWVYTHAHTHTRTLSLSLSLSLSHTHTHTHTHTQIDSRHSTLPSYNAIMMQYLRLFAVKQLFTITTLDIHISKTIVYNYYTWYTHQ